MPIRLTGTATVGMMVARMLPRNRKTTSTTSTKASASVLITSRIVSLTKVVESYMTKECNPGGYRGCSRARVAATALDVSTALAPGER